MISDEKSSQCRIIPSESRSGTTAIRAWDSPSFSKQGADLCGMSGVEEASHAPDQFQFFEHFPSRPQGHGTAGPPAGRGAGAEVAIPRENPLDGGGAGADAMSQARLSRAECREVGAEIDCRQTVGGRGIRECQCGRIHRQMDDLSDIPPRGVEAKQEHPAQRTAASSRPMREESRISWMCVQRRRQAGSGMKVATAQRNFTPQRLRELIFEWAMVRRSGSHRATC